MTARDALYWVEVDGEHIEFVPSRFEGRSEPLRVEFGGVYMDIKTSDSISSDYQGYALSLAY